MICTWSGDQLPQGLSALTIIGLGQHPKVFLKGIPGARTEFIAHDA
jgi:hypothetical protein